MFLYRRPRDGEIEKFIAAQAGRPFSYKDIGATRDCPAPAGATVDHNRILLGHGGAVYDKAIDALRRWQMFALTWVTLCSSAAPIEIDSTVAVIVRHYGFWSMNAARIVYTIEEPDRFGFAYGTLGEHAEAGEERFLIERNPDEDSIWYDLYAFSTPNALLARLGYPLTRGLQKRFARESLQAMRNAAL